jgi:hypothetical protein
MIADRPVVSVYDTARVLICVLLTAAVTATSVTAQPVGPARPPLGLNVSLPAAKRMAGAREFIVAADWDAAVKSLDSLTRDFGGTLIEVAPSHYQKCDGRSRRRWRRCWPPAWLPIADVDRRWNPLHRSCGGTTECSCTGTA